MEQKVRLPYDDVRRVFEEGGYLPIFCTTFPVQHLPEMIHTNSEEFGPDSIASQEAEQYYDELDDPYYDDPNYRPPFDPNGVVFTFHLPKRAELCTIKIRETKDGGTLVTFRVSQAYDPAFSPYLDCVAARYHTFIDDMRLLARGLADGKTVDSFLEYKRRQIAVVGRTEAVRLQEPSAGDTTPQPANGAQQQSPAPTSDETEQPEQASATAIQQTPEPESVQRGRRPDVEKRDKLILAIYQEHPEWTNVRICFEAAKRDPESSFTEDTIRNALRREGIVRKPQRAKRTR